MFKIAETKRKRKERKKEGHSRTPRAWRQMKERVDDGIAHARVESSVEPPPDTVKLDN